MNFKILIFTSAISCILAQRTIQLTSGQRFDIGDRIGHGSFGTVSEAKLSGPNDNFNWAYKVSKYTQQTCEDHDREAAALQAYQMLIAEQCSAGQLSQIVMTRVNGRTLRNTLAGSSPYQKKMFLEKHSAELSRLHASGWSHGDANAQNAMVDARNNVRLIDFGKSRQLETMDDEEKMLAIKEDLEKLNGVENVVGDEGSDSDDNDIVGDFLGGNDEVEDFLRDD